ncbi:unnamed protein product, partial [Linum tenue]
DEGQRFKKLIRESFDLSGTTNPVDFLPVLRWVDFSGLEGRMWAAHKGTDEFFQRLTEEHRSSYGEREGSNEKTMIDTMLSLQEAEPQVYIDEIIKGQIMTMILAGTDSSADTMEWGMSLLLNHPEILHKARAELDNVIGNDRLVQESDYAKLPYLQSIVYETLRLYPTGPLLMPHESLEDCVIGGYPIPKQTMLLVNAWAIHRDPAVWEEPTRFWPERHAAGVEPDGRKYLPFGVGRRSCPGYGLPYRVVSAALGALIQCFEWERVGEELVDMTEGIGLIMPKAEPLKALCKPRECMRNVFITM